MFQDLQDGLGRPIGLFDDQGDRIFLLDDQGMPIAYYDKATHSTYDAQGRYLGDGNLLLFQL